MYRWQLLYSAVQLYVAILVDVMPSDAPAATVSNAMTPCSVFDVVAAATAWQADSCALVVSHPTDECNEQQ